MRLLLTLAALALLAGCVEPDPAEDGDTTGPPTTSPPTTSPPGGGQGFAPQQGTAHGSANGIDLDVTWRACEAGYCANATATNRGSATVQVSSICVEPWADRMADEDGQPVKHQEDRAVCLAYGRAPFAPGDVAQHDFTWDGQVHDQDKPRDAPAGQYTWTLVFWYEANEGGERLETTADVHLLVGTPT